MKIRLFDSTNTVVDPVRLLRAQREMERSYRALHDLQRNDQISYNVRNTFPFNRLVWANRGFIGCHTLVANANLY
jgi:hypothetical protein